jgi:Cu-Zn family superoxide dismutase
MGWGKPPPPPPPSPPSLADFLKPLGFAEEQSPMAAAAIAVAVALLYWFVLKKPTKPIIAVCELGQAGKPSVEHERRSQAFTESAPDNRKDSPRAHLDRRGSSQQFVPEIASRVSGKVKLTQVGRVTTIEYRVVGLTPGKHGFHINEKADFSEGCKSAGPIYNPFNKNHGGPNDEDRHVGDLGNITADGTGVAKGTIRSDLIKLTGRYSVVNRSFIIHADEDDLVTGNAGARIAGGKIVLADE